jgi:hypothetical protein
MDHLSEGDRRGLTQLLQTDLPTTLPYHTGGSENGTGAIKMKKRSRSEPSIKSSKCKPKTKASTRPTDDRESSSNTPYFGKQRLSPGFKKWSAKVGAILHRITFACGKEMADGSLCTVSCTPN